WRPRGRTAVPVRSRGLQSEPLRARSDGVHEIGRRRKMLSIRFPTLRVHGRLLLEPLALEEIQPAIRARVDEQLEVWIERQLIVRREYRELDAAVAREQDL